MRAISQQPDVVDLGELVGLERASGRAAADASTDEDAARFSLFDRLSTVLTEAARRRPTAVVLDDLHWSDEPSLLALEFVSKHALTVPLLLVGTYREDEAGEALLRLAGGARIIELSGLAATDIAVLMTDLTGRVPGERLANEVWERTNGNPFLAREVTRLLAANSEDWAGIGTLTGRADRRTSGARRAALGGLRAPLTSARPLSASSPQPRVSAAGRRAPRARRAPCRIGADRNLVHAMRRWSP